MTTLTTNNEFVDEIGKIHFEGNIIPHTWYGTVTFENGKPDLVGMILLSEFVYWYRPTYVKDETTGILKQVKKKFRADLLQRSYDKMAEHFGISKRMAQDACKRLDDKGLIKRVLRDEVINGRNVNNNLYIRVEHENIRRLTFGEPLLSRKEIDEIREPVCDLSRSNVTPPHDEINDLPRSNVTPPTRERDTNTKITSDISLEISSKIKTPSVTQSVTGKVAPKKEKENKPTLQDYEKIINYLNEKTGKKFSHKVASNQKDITARFKEGYTVEQFIQVIDKKVFDWNERKDMRVYLRPITLFGAKFDSYLNEGGDNEINTASDPAIFNVSENLPNDIF